MNFHVPLEIFYRSVLVFIVIVATSILIENVITKRDRQAANWPIFVIFILVTMILLLQERGYSWK